MDASNWMEQSYDIIADKKLNELVIPGAHDCGTYTLEGDLTENLAPDVKESEYETIKYSAPISLGWAKTQSKSIADQLNDGIRYFDMRVSLDEGVFKFCHSFYGAKYEDMFDDIRSFIDKKPYEIVVLGMNHFWDYGYQKQYDLKPGNDASEGLTDEQHLEDFVRLVEEKFENRLVDGSSFSPKSMLNELWDELDVNDDEKHRNQVIVLINKPTWKTIKVNEVYQTIDVEKEINNTHFWFDSEHSNHVGAEDPKKYKDETLEAIINEQDAKTFFTIRSCITLDEDTYAKGIDPGTYPDDLKDLADETNPVILDWVKYEWSQYRLNLIWADFYHRTDLVKLAMMLNNIQSLSGDDDINPVFHPETSNWGNWKMSYELVLEAWIDEYAQAVNWVEGAGNWWKNAYKDSVKWVADVFVDSKEKAVPPSNGIRPSDPPEGIIKYRVRLEKIKVKNAGSEDLVGQKDLELYGAINVFPKGNLYSNIDANKYLWHKSSDQKKQIKEKKSLEIGTYKDFYELEDSVQASALLVKIHIKESDSGTDDKLYGEMETDLNSYKENELREYSEVVKSGSQKVQVFWTIKRINTTPKMVKNFVPR